VRDANTASRFNQYQESFRTWTAGVDAIYATSAKETGGERHVRFVTTADCKVDVREVELPAGGLNTFDATINGLKALGYNRTDRKYMIFGESKVYCGIGTFNGDTQPSRTTAATAVPATAAATPAAGRRASPRTNSATTSAPSTTTRRTPARPGTASMSTTSCATTTTTARG